MVWTMQRFSNNAIGSLRCCSVPCYPLQNEEDKQKMEISTLQVPSVLGPLPLCASISASTSLLWLSVPL